MLYSNPGGVTASEPRAWRTRTERTGSGDRNISWCCQFERSPPEGTRASALEEAGASRASLCLPPRPSSKARADPSPRAPLLHIRRLHDVGLGHGWLPAKESPGGCSGSRGSSWPRQEPGVGHTEQVGLRQRQRRRIPVPPPPSA